MKIYFDTVNGNYYTVKELMHIYKLFRAELVDRNFYEYMDRVIKEGMMEEIDKSTFAAVVAETGLYLNAVNLMDDELREKIHNDLYPCTQTEFLTAYAHAHKNKYNEEFTF